MAKATEPVKMKLRKGDTVRVIAGKDIGKEGDVMRVLPKVNKVIVDGVNIAKKHQKPTRATQQGGIIDKDMPIHASNVMIVCSKCGPTRIGFKVEGETKTRICKKCGGEI